MATASQVGPDSFCLIMCFLVSNSGSLGNQNLFLTRHMKLSTDGFMRLQARSGEAYSVYSWSIRGCFIICPALPRSLCIGLVEGGTLIVVNQPYTLKKPICTRVLSCWHRGSESLRMNFGIQLGPYTISYCNPHKLYGP